MDVQNWVSDWIDAHEKELRLLSREIWSYAELSGQEFQSSQALCQKLEEYGFTVVRGLGRLSTAFSASYGSGAPVIGFLGEFDALEALSQKADCAHQEAVENCSSGHGCGHNLLGCGSLAAAIAAKEFMVQHHLPGRIVYYGCPAEEFGCGKMHIADAGCFQELDAALTWHPMDHNEVDGQSSLATQCMEFHFTGRAAHAAACPQDGRNALHAAELLNIAANFMRESLIPEARLHYAMTNAGGAAINVIQASASVAYEIRAPRQAQLQEICSRLLRAAQGAEMMTDTQMRVTYGDQYLDFIPSHTLNCVLWEQLQKVGAPLFTASENMLAAELRQTFSTAGGGKQPPLCQELSPYQGVSGSRAVSTDVGNVSHIVPTVQLYTTCCALGTPGHSWQMVSQAGGGIGERGMLTAAKVLALTGVALLKQPELLKQAYEELNDVLNA